MRYKDQKRQPAPDLPVSTPSKRNLEKPYVIWFRAKKDVPSFWRRDSFHWKVWKRYEKKAGRDQSYAQMMSGNYWPKYYDLRCEDLK